MKPHLYNLFLLSIFETKGTYKYDCLANLNDLLSSWLFAENLPGASKAKLNRTVIFFAFRHPLRNQHPHHRSRNEDRRTSSYSECGRMANTKSASS